jgi:gluconokinase
MEQPVLPKRWVVMGVSGSGKSSVARQLAERLDVQFAEGDDDHPPQNIAKMESGQPLNDADRQGWLAVLRDRIRRAADQDQSVVLTCSALKRRYRDMLREGDPELMFVHLHGDRELIESRMQSRSRHFMPASLLDSQLRDLEPPGEDERAVRLDIKHSPEELADQAIRHARAQEGSTANAGNIAEKNNTGS